MDFGSPILHRFGVLCETPSPTGSERQVADLVAGELRDLGIEVTEDGAAFPACAGAGNLVARIPGTGDAWVMFCAHLDTVPHDDIVEVYLSDGVFESNRETILGADNKAAVTVLVELATRAAAEPRAAGIELVFTVAEEDGLRGARELDLESLRAPYGFVLDHASPIGEILTSGPTYNRVHGYFTGVEAHAGIRPEDGRSAIEAAAAAINAMELGRLDEGTTANVGRITGGTATNIVPGDSSIKGEARSLDAARASEVTEAMVDACVWAANERGCDLEIDVEEVFRSYRVPSSAAPVKVAAEALRRRGHEPRELPTGGGSDANTLLERGFDCVLLANGTEANHTSEERVAVAAIHEMLEVCESIVEVAAEHAAQVPTA